MSDAFVRSALVEPLGLALLHFVWQGAVISAIAAAALALLRRSAPQARYLVGCLALAAMFVAPVGTVWLLMAAHEAGDSASGLATATPLAVAPFGLVSEPLATGLAPASDQWTDLESWLPVAVMLWSLGVALMTVRLLRGWWQVSRLRRRINGPLPAEVRAVIERLARQMGVTRPITSAESARIEVPTVVGWWHPLLLVPASSLTGLPPVHLEAILAHEIAHIRRLDYLVNLAQSVVETLFFYHPGVWWVSRQVRLERESCCDDLAASVCGDRLSYAGALASLEELRLSASVLALSARGGDLVSRVRRLIEPAVPDTGHNAVWVMAFALGLLALMPLAASTTSMAISEVEPGEVTDTFLMLEGPGVAVENVGGPEPPAPRDGEEQIARVPIGYAPSPEGTPLRVREIGIDGDGFRVELENTGVLPISSVAFVGIAERRPWDGPVQILSSPEWAVSLQPGATTRITDRWLDASQLDTLIAERPGRLQLFLMPGQITYANGNEWKVVLDASAQEHSAAIREEPAEIPRSMVTTVNPLAATTPASCRDDRDRGYSQGALIRIRGEQGKVARCEDGRWIEVAVPGLQTHRSRDEDVVHAFEEFFRAAKEVNDVALLDLLLDPGYVGVNQNGNVRDKASVLELFRSFPIQSLKLGPLSLRTAGDIVTVSGSQTEVNATGTDEMLFTRVWRRDGEGVWRLLSNTQFRRP
jgi:beta-lactamase regulating signal transducer with metallopeptidase domain